MVDLTSRLWCAAAGASWDAGTWPGRWAGLVNSTPSRLAVGGDYKGSARGVMVKQASEFLLWRRERSIRSVA
ncbi:hypothetical protein BJX66DRAFT_172467 [Aspergillus keveii]|uniref:Uncharacterized protein n=1 Tax=Aspergillus keveii TaxID=714993 RepID=A0ABR4FHC6_9EURO